MDGWKRIAPLIGSLCLFLLGNQVTGQVTALEIEVNWVNWASDNRVSLYTPSDQLIISICDPDDCETTLVNSSYSTLVDLGCYPDLTDYYLVATDAYGDAWNGTGNFVTVTGNGGNLVTYDLTSGFGPDTVYFDVSGGGSCPTNDAVLFAINSPSTGCDLSNSETVDVTIRNNGTATITSCPIEYRINGGSFVSGGTYNGSIASGATDTYQFNADFSTGGSNVLEVRAVLTGDSDASNDTAQVDIYNSIPHDFNSGAFNMGFEANEESAGWTVVDDNGDNFRWNLDNQDAPNTGSQSANYTYNPNSAADDWMLSPCLDMEAGSQYELTYFYRVQSSFYPEDMEVLLMNSTTPGTPVTTIASFSNLTTTTYTQDVRTINVGSTGTYYIAWRMTSPADQWDMYIDDVEIRKIVNLDATVTDVVLPGDACGLSGSENVTATIENLGQQSINNIDIEYRLNNGSWVSAGTYTAGPLTSGSTDTYDFTVDLSGSGTVYTVDVRTQLTGDELPGNDELTGSQVEHLAPFDFNTGIITMGFEASDDESSWVTLNNNGDGFEWDIDGTINPRTGSEAANYRRSTTNTADDWIFTPCLDLDPGNTYQVSFWYRVQNASFPERLTVYVMSDQTAGGVVSTIVDLNTFNNTSYQEQASTFTVGSSGTYYLAFQAASPASRRRLFLDDIEIRDVYSYWIGNSTDWSDANNWSDGVPTTGSNVLIPTSPSGGNFPTVNSASTCGDLTIESGASLNFGSSGQLSVAGNWVNNSTFDPQEGEIVLNGTSAQTLTGATTFNDLTINNSNGVTVSSGEQSVRSALTLTDGTLTTNNLVRLISDPLGDARLAPVTGGSVSGDMIIERYIDAGNTNWRFLAAPTNDATFDEWTDDFITTGFTGSDFPLYSFVSIQGYEETLTGQYSNGFDPISSSTESITSGTGWFVYAGDGQFTNSAFTVEVQGTPTIGDVNFPVTFTSSAGADEDGWVLVGNPYASTIDWESGAWTKSNINDAIYIWDPDNDQYATYINGSSTNNGSRYIASGQAFWVHCNANNPILTATEDVKVTNTTPFFSQGPPQDELKLNLSGNGKFDEVVIHFQEGGNPDFTPKEDAYKLFSSSWTAPQMGVRVDQDRALAVDVQPALTSDYSAAIVAYTYGPGTHTLSYSGIETFDPSVCIFIEDVVTGNLIDVRNDPPYVFTLGSTQQVRFKIHFQAAASVDIEHASCFGEEDGEVTVGGYGPGSWKYEWKDEAGITFLTETGSTSPSTVSNLAAGNYTVEVSGNGYCPSTAVDVVVTEPQEVISRVHVPVTTVELDPVATVAFQNASRHATSYYWDFGDGNTSSEEHPTHDYTVAGTYRVALTAVAENGCEAESYITIEVLPTQDPDDDNGTGNGGTVDNDDPGSDNGPDVSSTTTSIEVIFPEEELIRAQIDLMNTAGQRVLPTQNLLIRNNQFSVPTDGLATGIYFLEIRSETKSWTEKVFVQ